MLSELSPFPEMAARAALQGAPAASALPGSLKLTLLQTPNPLVLAPLPGGGHHRRAPQARPGCAEQGIPRAAACLVAPREPRLLLILRPRPVRRTLCSPSPPHPPLQTAPHNRSLANAARIGVEASSPVQELEVLLLIVVPGNVMRAQPLVKLCFPSQQQALPPRDSAPRTLVVAISTSLACHTRPPR